MNYEFESEFSLLRYSDVARVAPTVETRSRRAPHIDDRASLAGHLTHPTHTLNRDAEGELIENVESVTRRRVVAGVAPGVDHVAATPAHAASIDKDAGDATRGEKPVIRNDAVPKVVLVGATRARERR